jgi:hypothetical protein
MTMSLGDARTEVRDLIDEANAQFWTDAQLNTWINQGCWDIARRALCLRQTSQVPVIAEVQNYPAPVDMYQLYRIEFVPSTGSFIYPLTFMGYNEADQAWGTYQSFPAAWPEIVVLWNNPGVDQVLVNPSLSSPLQMRLFPVPAQTGTLNVFYYRNVVTAVNDGDQLDTLPGWEDLAVEYAVYKAKRKDKEADWQDAFNFYEARLNDLIMVSGNFHDQAGTFSTGQGQWPPWAIGSYGGSDW